MSRTERIIGTMGYGAGRAVEKELSRSQAPRTVEYPKFMRELNAARRERGVMSPCQVAPKFWDGIDLEHSFNPESGELGQKAANVDEEYDRLRFAQRKCFLECQYLMVCASGLRYAEQEKVEGMFAGVLLGKGKTYDKIREVLDSGNSGAA